MKGTLMTNKAFITYDNGLLTIVVPFIRPYSGFISHGGTLHGGRLTGHEKSPRQDVKERTGMKGAKPGFSEAKCMVLTRGCQSRFESEVLLFFFLGGLSVPLWLVVSNICYFHPYLGKIPILTNIFPLGWNHQLEKVAFRTGNFLFQRNLCW